jgi:hypothetical protein
LRRGLSLLEKVGRAFKFEELMEVSKGVIDVAGIDEVVRINITTGTLALSCHIFLFEASPATSF